MTAGYEAQMIYDDMDTVMAMCLVIFLGCLGVSLAGIGTRTVTTCGGHCSEKLSPELICKNYFMAESSLSCFASVIFLSQPTATY